MEETSFVERTFELGQQSVVARFGRPEKAAGGEFRCFWSLEWPDRTVRHHACGEDSVQALLLAMRTAHSELLLGAADRGGRITLDGQDDLDLPPAWPSAAPNAAT